MIGDRLADDHGRRAKAFGVVVLILLGGLGARLAKLQILDATSYTGESRNNSVREL